MRQLNKYVIGMLLIISLVSFYNENTNIINQNNMVSNEDIVHPKPSTVKLT